MLQARPADVPGRERQKTAGVDFSVVRNEEVPLSGIDPLGRPPNGAMRSCEAPKLMRQLRRAELQGLRIDLGGPQLLLNVITPE